MRTDEERIKAMHERAANIKREARRRKVMVIQAAASVVSFAAVIVFACLVPGIVGKGMPEIVSGGMNASIFSGNDMLGYIVTGVLAFLLGASVTIFCYRLKKWEEEKDRDRVYDR